VFVPELQLYYVGAPKSADGDARILVFKAN